MKSCFPWMEIEKKVFTRECLKDRNSVNGGLPSLLFHFIYLENMMVHKVGGALDKYLLFWFIIILQRAIFERFFYCGLILFTYLFFFSNVHLIIISCNQSPKIDLHKVLSEAKGVVTCKRHETHADMKFHTCQKFLSCTLRRL